MIMDPDPMLDQIRNICEYVNAGSLSQDPPEDLAILARLITDLDLSLSNGGPLPNDWMNWP